MIRFNLKYFLCTILLLGIEVFIALFIHDRIIRPHIGDLLVVILIYCFVKSFFNISVYSAAFGVLVFSYVVEALQYIEIVKLLGMNHSHSARVIIGTSFSWIDIIAYTVGVTIVLFFEKRWYRYFLNKKALYI
jgi:hypothetical protein